MNRPIHFDLVADDQARAKKFYEDAFGWKFEKWDGPMEYWLITTGEDEKGINGGMTKNTDDKTAPIQRTLTLDSKDIEADMEKIKKVGGKVEDKMTIPGVGYMSFFNDPEGNVLGLMQDDESAKE